ncbi:uncharacterized protein [Setaria viridis]|uniref:uncharacterized protein n=1 Tax=Setaria viridis TaxID=4556 RepID=UPI003B3B37F7
MSISLRDCIRKRREEKDDERMMFIFPTLYLMGFAREGGVKKKRHTSEETGEVKVRRLLEGYVKNCQVTFRMEPHIFKEVATYLRRKRFIVDTRITVEEKLGFFLYMLSRNASYEDLAVTFGHSNDTFHCHINHFFNKVIPTLSRRFLQSPNPNQVHPKILENPRYYPFFKNCLGAIDGTHIPVSISPEKHSPFKNRKGTLSINMMVACDFDLNITFISSGWEGSVTDSRVLRSAMSKDFQVPPSKFYLVDGGYANIPSFLAPYRGVRYHLKEFGARHRRPQNSKELFNHHHALLRNHVERTLSRFLLTTTATKKKPSPKCSGAKRSADSPRGHLAEGTNNFTSIESQCVEEPLHQIDDVEDGAQAKEETLQEIHEIHDEEDGEKDARDEQEEARSGQ